MFFLFFFFIKAILKNRCQQASSSCIHVRFLIFPKYKMETLNVHIHTYGDFKHPFNLTWMFLCHQRTRRHYKTSKMHGETRRAEKPEKPWLGAGLQCAGFLSIVFTGGKTRGEKNPIKNRAYAPDVTQTYPSSMKILGAYQVISLKTAFYQKDSWSPTKQTLMLDNKICSDIRLLCFYILCER